MSILLFVVFYIRFIIIFTERYVGTATATTSNARSIFCALHSVSMSLLYNAPVDYVQNKGDD